VGWWRGAAHEGAGGIRTRCRGTPHHSQPCLAHAHTHTGATHVPQQEESIITAAIEAETAAARAEAAAAKGKDGALGSSSRARPTSHASLLDGAAFDALDDEFGAMSLADARMRPARPAGASPCAWGCVCAAHGMRDARGACVGAWHRPEWRCAACVAAGLLQATAGAGRCASLRHQACSSRPQRSSSSSRATRAAATQRLVAALLRSRVQQPRQPTLPLQPLQLMVAAAVRRVPVGRTRATARRQQRRQQQLKLTRRAVRRRRSRRRCTGCAPRMPATSTARSGACLGRPPARGGGGGMGGLGMCRVLLCLDHCRLHVHAHICTRRRV
jgi:hypothetical protein